MTQSTITKAEADAIEKLNKKKEFVNAIIAQCRHLCGSFKHSGQLSLKLKEKQTEMNYETKIKLIQDVSNRWNTTSVSFNTSL